MKFVFVLLLAGAALAAVSAETKKVVADQEFLTQQKNLLRLFVRPSQFNLYKDQAEIGKNFKFEENYDKFTNVEAIKKFVYTFKQGMLPAKETFSVFYPEYLEQAVQLFNVFYFAKDFDTFYKSACWARDYMNEGQFIYALSIAVSQREDCKNYVLPPVYEIYPQYFVKSEYIKKAFEIKMQGEHYTPVENEAYKVDNTYFIPTNYSGAYYTKSREEALSYFTEDVGLNAFNTYWNYYYPFWANSSFYDFKFDRRGELFYYTRQQLLARYHLERLSNGFKEVKPFSYFSAEKPFVGYEPSLNYLNGKQFPSRPTGYKASPYKLEGAVRFEKRITDAIDGDFIYTKEKKKLSLYGKEGINYLGEMIAGTGNSPNKEFYGDLYYKIRTVFGHTTDPAYQYSVAPSALEQCFTALRDPAYYVLYKRIDNIFKNYKCHSPSYSYDKLTFPGVKVESVKFVDKLVTYFDKFDFALDNIVDVGKSEDIDKVDIRAHQSRLNHKPYTYKVKVNSDKETNAFVRVFLGPKYDYLGNEYSLDKMREYMVEMDRFTFKLIVGSNTIERNSKDSNVAVSERPSFRELFTKINKAIAGEEQYHVDEYEHACGWPQRLLLPKGTKGGLQFRFFVMVTPFDETLAKTGKKFEFSSVPYCGVGKYGSYPDKEAMGYPFDRKINDYEYFYNNPSMKFEDVVIFHSEGEVTPVPVHRH